MLLKSPNGHGPKSDNGKHPCYEKAVYDMCGKVKELTSNASRHAGNGQPGNGLKCVIRTRHCAEAVADGNSTSARALGSESAEGKVSAEVGQLGKLFGSIH